MDDSGDVANVSSQIHECLHGLAGRDINFGRCDLQTCIAQHFRRSFSRFWPQVREHYMFARTDSPSDGLTNRTRANYHSNIRHFRIPAMD